MPYYFSNIRRDAKRDHHTRAFTLASTHNGLHHGTLQFQNCGRLFESNELIVNSLISKVSNILMIVR